MSGVASAEALVALVDLWWRTAPGWAVLVGLAGLLALLVDRLLPRGRWLEARSALWILVLLRAALPPSIGPPWGARLGESHLLRALAGSSDVQAATAASWRRWLLAAAPAAWIAGAAILLAVLAARSVHHRRRLLRSSRGAEPALVLRMRAHARRLALSRPPLLLCSPLVAVPQVSGVIRPILVVPVSFSQAPGREVDAALVHELAHLGRRDPLRASLLLATGAILWIHPVIWLAIRRLEVLRECACDRLCVRHLEDAVGYRRALAWWGRAVLAQAALDAGPRTAGLALMRRCHPLIERLERLDQLARGQDPAGWRRLAGLAAAFTLAACLPAIRPPAPLLRPDPAVPGCLAERYAVLAELARQTGASAIRERTVDTPPDPPPAGSWWGHHSQRTARSQRGHTTSPLAHVFRQAPQAARAQAD